MNEGLEHLVWLVRIEHDHNYLEWFKDRIGYRKNLSREQKSWLVLEIENKITGQLYIGYPDRFRRVPYDL